MRLLRPNSYIVSPIKATRGNVKPKGFWNKRQNRREFLLELAKELSFNPLVPSNWQTVTRSQVAAKQVLSASILYILSVSG